MGDYPDLGPFERTPNRASPRGPRRMDRDEPLWRRAASSPASRPPQRTPNSRPPLQRAPVSRPPRLPAVEAPPALAIYAGEDTQEYRLRDFETGLAAQAPKRRAAPEVFPPTRAERAPGAGLLRASGYALFGALLGGAPGLALGVVVAVIALARLARFERRTRVWRAKRGAQHGDQRLPARATNERLRLLTALWQSLGAVALGGIALLLLFTVML